MCRHFQMPTMVWLKLKKKTIKTGYDGYERYDFLRQEWLYEQQTMLITEDLKFKKI